MIIQYYDDLFCSHIGDEIMSDRVKFQTITNEQSQNLVLPITVEEVKAAVFAMHPDKLLGRCGRSCILPEIF